MINCRKYLESVYEFFFQNNNECFVGTKRELRYNLQMNLNIYIDNTFLEKTLIIFRDLRLIKKEITSDIIVKVTIGDLYFTDTKSVYPGIKMNAEVLDDRLSRAELALKNDFQLSVNELIKFEELNYIRKFQEEKRNLCKEIMGKVIHEYFFNIYDKEFGFWIHDVDRKKFLEDKAKLKTYTRDYFKLKKLKQDDDTIINKNLRYFYSEVMEKLLNILIKKIEINNYILITISNISNSMFLESKVTKVIYDKEKSILSFYSTRDFYCKININEISIDKDNTVIIEDGTNIFKLIDILAVEERKELDYMADLYSRLHTPSVV